jgi:hypothetical protein
MGMVRRRITPHNNLGPWDLHVDANPEQVSLPAARVPALDDDAARYDPIEEAFELLGALMYSRRDRIGRFHVTKRDLQWQLHRILLCSR